MSESLALLGFLEEVTSQSPINSLDFAKNLMKRKNVDAMPKGKGLGRAMRFEITPVQIQFYM